MIKLIISALWLVGQAAKTPASHAGNAGSIPARVTIVGVDCDEVPPVPIPNTEVKLIGAEDTWLEAARENRLMPTPAVAILRTYSSLAQSVEHAAVNRRVVRSSRTGGAKAPPCILSAAFFQRVFSSVGQSPRLITGWSRVRVPEDPPNRKDACWRLFYLAGLGERRPFYRFSGRCPDVTQRGNRNGSPFTLPPPCGGEKLVRGRWRLFYLAGLGERRPFYGFSGRCPDLTQRGNRNGSPFTLPPPCGGEKPVRGWWRLFAAIMRASRGGRLFYTGSIICGGCAGELVQGAGPQGRPPQAAARGRRPRSPPLPGRAALRAIGWGFCGAPDGWWSGITSSDGPGPPAGRRIAGRDRRPAGTGYTECCPQAGRSARRWPKSPQRRLRYRRRRPAAARTR